MKIFEQSKHYQNKWIPYKPKRQKIKKKKAGQMFGALYEGNIVLNSKLNAKFCNIKYRLSVRSCHCQIIGL